MFLTLVKENKDALDAAAAGGAHDGAAGEHGDNYDTRADEADINKLFEGAEQLMAITDYNDSNRARAILLVLFIPALSELLPLLM